MLIEYSFPPEVQKWIIGKRVTADNDTLAKCGIKTSGMVMYLYLISPKSIGLTQQKIMRKYRHLLPSGEYSAYVFCYIIHVKRSIALVKRYNFTPKLTAEFT